MSAGSTVCTNNRGLDRLPHAVAVVCPCLISSSDASSQQEQQQQQALFAQRSLVTGDWKDKT